MKYWEFPIGETDHQRKEQKTATEITLILKGKAKGEIQKENVVLEGGQYFIIHPGSISNFPKTVLDHIVGITIKFPSIPGDTKKLGN